MEFIVHDTLTPMAELLEQPLERRPDLLRELLAPIRQAIPMPGDIVDIHHGGSGFRVDAEDPRYLPALRAMMEADVLGQIERELYRAADRLAGLELPGSVRVFFVLGNPDDEQLMKITGGYYGMGSSPGLVYLIGWPNEGTIGRFAHCAVHEFHHQARYTNVQWHPTVGEHVVSEGLAEAFVRELSGSEAMGPWSSMVTGEELDRAYAKIMADFDLEGMHLTSAYVLGDTTMARFGQEPRGIPDMAGYAVGLRLVDAHLAATGMTVAESTALPVSQIVRRSGVSSYRGETKPDS